MSGPGSLDAYAALLAAYTRAVDAGALPFQPGGALAEAAQGVLPLGSSILELAPSLLVEALSLLAEAEASRSGAPKAALLRTWLLAARGRLQERGEWSP